MNKSLIALVASAAACLCIGAQAADDTTTAAPSDTSTSVPLTPGQADMARIKAKADYKASQDEADATLKRANADCIADTAHSQSACRAAARAQAKKDKADAKLAYAQKQADIKTNTQQ